MPSAVDSSIETGRIGGGIAPTEALTLGKEGLKEAPVTPLLPPVRPARPSRSSSRSGNVVPSTLLPRNSRNMNHFPISDTSDSAYSEWLVQHSLPPSPILASLVLLRSLLAMMKKNSKANL